MTFPRDALKNQWSPENRELLFNEGRSARDTNMPLNVVMGYDSQYVVYHDDYEEVMHDAEKGAQAIPVKIVMDDSNLFDEKTFWSKLNKDDIAYTQWSGVISQKDSKKEDDLSIFPTNDIREIKNDIFLCNLHTYIPLIKMKKKTDTEDRPAQLVTSKYPIGVRIEGKVSPFVFYKMAQSLQKRIEADEKKRKDDRNFDEKSKNIPDLTGILTEISPDLPLDALKRLQDIIKEAYSEGDFTHIPNFKEGVRMFDGVSDVGALNIPLLLGVSDQINIIVIG